MHLIQQSLLTIAPVLQCGCCRDKKKKEKRVTPSHPTVRSSRCAELSRAPTAGTNWTDWDAVRREWRARCRRRQATQGAGWEREEATCRRFLWVQLRCQHRRNHQARRCEAHLSHVGASRCGTSCLSGFIKSKFMKQPNLNPDLIYFWSSVGTPTCRLQLIWYCGFEAWSWMEVSAAVSFSNLNNRKFSTKN